MNSISSHSESTDIKLCRPRVYDDFDWLICALRSSLPKVTFEGKYFDFGYQFGIAATVYQPDGKRRRTAFRIHVYETVRCYTQVFPSKYEREHKKALSILEKAGIGWWVPDEDYLDDKKRAAWDQAVRIIHSLPAHVQDRKLIYENKFMYGPTDRKNDLIERAIGFFSSWIKEVNPTYQA